MRELLALIVGAALLAVAWKVERHLAPDLTCWRCAGVGELQRWHRFGWKSCPRCDGTGRRPRRWTR